MITLDDYRHVAPPGTVDMLHRLADRVRGRKLLHVTGGRLGGGAAETLRGAVPLLSELGLEAAWEITEGEPRYLAAARVLQAALEGAERVLAEPALERYLEINRANAGTLPLDADVIVVHDVPPAALVAERRGGTWIWRCHFDCSTPQQGAWSFFRPLAGRFDAAVYSLPEFAGPLGIPGYVIAPSIDPLSDKNREMPAPEVERVLGALGVARDKPLLLQVAPLEPGGDPLGTINAYRIVKKHHDVRLVLAGAAGDGDGAEVTRELREAATQDPDIVVLELPTEAHRQINALQRAATIVLQKSARDASGLGAAEALWKGKPVIASVTGALPQLVIHEVTGYLVRSPEGAAFRVRQLLNNRELIARLGATGREHVRRGFLLTRQILDYLALVTRVTL